MAILLPCPFCGRNPHKGPTKTQFDQMHGEAFQRYRIWCPRGCAAIEQVNEGQAAESWNTRGITVASELLLAARQAEAIIADHLAGIDRMAWGEVHDALSQAIARASL